MSSVNARGGCLFFDFRYLGVRCREYTKLADTPANRKRMQKVLDKIEQAIVEGSFDYGAFFPGSKLAARFAQGGPTAQASLAPALNDHVAQVSTTDAPLFTDFLDDWYCLMLPSWRISHANTVSSMIRLHLKHHLGQIRVDQITKTDILQMRVELSKRKGRAGNETLSAKSINKIIQLLKQALADAAERYGFTNPAIHVKRLKQRRIDIQPFSLAETRALIDAVRPDYRPYMIVRLLTGMRTGEIHGLKWKFVDFEHRQILVRETVIRGRTEYTKTDGSQREIAISAPVMEALLEQRKRTGELDYVFCTANGMPLDNDNFIHRVWNPLLRHLGLKPRRPYQTRHTCATLWLASGENPEWVARQLGHVDTTMLFKTYSRYIPNLTRTDGSAFDSLMSNVIDVGEGLRGYKAGNLDPANEDGPPANPNYRKEAQP